MKLQDWIKSEPFTLSLSSGYFSFFTHCGMLAALEELDIKPNKVTGASAGALVAGCYAAGLSTEQMLPIMLEIKKEDFWDPGLGFGFLKGSLAQKLLSKHLPVKMFSECAVPCSISAYSVNRRRLEIIRDGDLSSAIIASCAVPGLLQPVSIGDSLYLDGALGDRHGLRDTDKNERIFYHHIYDWLPWKMPIPLKVRTPQRVNMKTLVIKNVPKVSPNQLALGESAFHAALSATRKALSKEVFSSDMIIMRVYLHK